MAKSFNLENVPSRLAALTIESGSDNTFEVVLDVSDDTKYRKALDHFFPGAVMTAKAIASEETAGCDIQMRGKLVDVRFTVRSTDGKEVLKMEAARVQGKPKLAIGEKANTIKITAKIVGAIERGLILRAVDAVRSQADVVVDFGAAQTELEDHDGDEDDSTPDIFKRENTSGKGANA